MCTKDNTMEQTVQVEADVYHSTHTMKQQTLTRYDGVCVETLISYIINNHVVYEGDSPAVGEWNGQRARDHWHECEHGRAGVRRHACGRFRDGDDRRLQDGAEHWDAVALVGVAEPPAC